MLRACRKYQRTVHGRAVIALLVMLFIGTAGISHACAAASVGAHCEECPDEGSDDSCSDASLCVFAGTALLDNDGPMIAAAPAPADRIENESASPPSVCLIPPDPPPIRG